MHFANLDHAPISSLSDIGKIGPQGVLAFIIYQDKVLALLIFKRIIHVDSSRNTLLYGKHVKYHHLLRCSPE